MTSAPMSASRCVAKGPEAACSNASTRTPSRGGSGLRPLLVIRSDIGLRVHFGLNGGGPHPASPAAAGEEQIRPDSFILLRALGLGERADGGCVGALPDHDAAGVIDHDSSIL